MAQGMYVKFTDDRLRSERSYQMKRAQTAKESHLRSIAHYRVAEINREIRRRRAESYAEALREMRLPNPLHNPASSRTKADEGV